MRATQTVQFALMTSTSDAGRIENDVPSDIQFVKTESLEADVAHLLHSMRN